MSISTPNSELANEVARDWLRSYMASFSYAIRRERATSQTASGAMIDGLAGVVALTIAGGHDFKDEIVEATITALRTAIDRDLSHLKK